MLLELTIKNKQKRQCKINKKSACLLNVGVPPDTFLVCIVAKRSDTILHLCWLCDDYVFWVCCRPVIHKAELPAVAWEFKECQIQLRSGQKKQGLSIIAVVVFLCFVDVLGVGSRLLPIFGQTWRTHVAVAYILISPRICSWNVASTFPQYSTLPQKPSEARVLYSLVSFFIGICTYLGPSRRCLI